ncbi:ComF family protein [Amaricoccus tamworthensis]|uniref:ComF family protein n=1 Tax=Amaricoccus tamworthensis TaxID=57002 RepID=UPI003C79B94C
MLDTLKSAMINSVVNTIFPPRCLACSESTDAPHGLCPDCWKDTHFISGDTCCKCGVPLVGEAGEDDTCETCQRHPPAWNRGAAALLYNGAGRRMVLALKHGDRLDTVRPLARWMALAGDGVIDRSDMIAPVPLHWRRLLKRRYNQSAELARALSRISGKEARTQLLMRKRFTTPQEKMDRTARAENQSGAFAVNPKELERLQGKAVLIVDDVLTSGSTLSGCAETLLAAGAAEVNVLVLCRVAFDPSINI